MSCVLISKWVIQLMVNSHSLELEFKLRSLALLKLNPELWISADNEGGLVSARLNPWNPESRHNRALDHHNCKPKKQPHCSAEKSVLYIHIQAERVMIKGLLT